MEFTIVTGNAAKARQAFAALKRPVVVEDGALVIPVLGGFSVPYSKYIFEKSV